MLRGGADDIGGTLMEETISRMAGSENGSRAHRGRADGDRGGGGPPGAPAHDDLRGYPEEAGPGRAPADGGLSGPTSDRTAR